MFWSSGTSSTNVVTFWLKLAFMRFCLFSCLTLPPTPYIYLGMSFFCFCLQDHQFHLRSFNDDIHSRLFRFSHSIWPFRFVLSKSWHSSMFQCVSTSSGYQSLLSFKSLWFWWGKVWPSDHWDKTCCLDQTDLCCFEIGSTIGSRKERESIWPREPQGDHLGFYVLCYLFIVYK